MEAMTLTRYLLAAAICMPQLARGFEPFNVQKEPEEIRALDHLEPVDRAAPEFRYLAQYWAEPQYEDQRYVVVVQDDAAQRFYVEQGSPPKCERILNGSYAFKRRVEISSETATMIRGLWTNVLLQTHYARKSVSVIVTNSTRCTFSTFVLNLGWMHGYMWYSHRGSSSDLAA
jgi:hypothetical protein